MRHSKIFKRENGKKVKIDVRIDFYSGRIQWKTYVSHCEKRKRKFIDSFSDDDWEYRQLPFASVEREQYELNKQLEYCTLEEIQEVKKELIQKIPLD